MKIGWMSPRVGVGFARMGSEAEADRRRGVVDLGLDFASDSGCSLWDEAAAFVP